MPVEALGPYDDSNIFARILRGEIPSQRVYEDDFAIAFTTSTRRRRCTCW